MNARRIKEGLSYFLKIRKISKPLEDNWTSLGSLERILPKKVCTIEFGRLDIIRGNLGCAAMILLIIAKECARGMSSNETSPE